jgi:hypothetical protein
MNGLQKLMIIGAGMGIAHQMAALLPTKDETRPMTEIDREAMRAAEEKRQRRAARNRAMEVGRG